MRRLCRKEKETKSYFLGVYERRRDFLGREKKQKDIFALRKKD